MVAQLFFEDNDGRRDTLTFGDIEGANINFLDENLGEIDVKESALDDFDVRFFMASGVNPNVPRFIYGDCDHQDFDIFICDPNYFGSYNYETKVLFAGLPQCSSNQITAGFFEFFIPKQAAFPITIVWDSTFFQDNCRSLANISEIPITEQSDTLRLSLIHI